MNPPDELERRAARLPLRPPPPGWREEILRAARAASQPAPATATARTGVVAGWLRDLLWPHPAAWAGLAAVWVVVLALNLAAERTALPRFTVTPPSRELQGVLREQRELLSSLLNDAPAPLAEPPRPGPRLRGQRRGEASGTWS